MIPLRNIILSLLFVSGLGHVLAVEPRLSNILPAGGQRGTDVEVTFSGARLADAQEVVIYSPGISVAAFAPETNRVKVTLKLAADCRLGEHVLRVRTATGVSEARTFWVGPFPVLAESEPNNDPTTGQKLTNNVTIRGIVAADDLDHFTVAAQKGQRITAEVEALRLGRSSLDPFVAILDSTGRTLADSEDTAFGFQDGVVSIVVPAAGDYTVLVRETAFSGKEDYYYRLHVGSFPRPTAAYPVAAQAGTKAKVQFLGDPKGELTQEIKFPAAANEKFGVVADGAPSPNWMRVTPHPVALEAEPTDSREQAGEVRDVPVVFNGIISKPGDHDWFRFRAKKGQNLQVSVFARRLRSPLDSAMQIVTPKGTPVSDNDDTAGPDSSITFKADEDGEYALYVRDFLRRGGPDFTYCVEVAPVAPSIAVRIPEVARNDTQTRQYIAVPRGNRFAALMSVRRANVAGEVNFLAAPLPPGVKLVAESLPAKADQFPVVFEAKADAPVDGRLVDFLAATTNANGVEGHFRNDIELVQGPNNTSYYGTRVDKLLVAVTEAAPFRVRVEPPVVPLVQGGTMDLKVIVERDAGFDEPIVLKSVWNPPGVTSQPDITIPKGSNSGTFPLSAKPDAEMREWKIALSAAAKVNGGELMISSALTPVTVGEPFVTATMEKATCEPGKATNIVVKLEQRIPFEGKAVIRIVGLSEKVSVTEKEITKDDKEVVFPIQVAADCGTGSQRNLFCSLLVKKDGVIIPHNLAAGGIFRVTPPKKPAEPQKKVASK